MEKQKAKIPTIKGFFIDMQMERKLMSSPLRQHNAREWRAFTSKNQYKWIVLPKNSFRPSRWKTSLVNFSIEFLIGSDIWQYLLVTFEDETFPAYFSFHGHIFVVHRKHCWWRNSNCGSRLSDITACQLDPKHCPSNKPLCSQQRSWESIVCCHIIS